jgi:hypothetical protein
MMMSMPLKPAKFLLSALAEVMLAKPPPVSTRVSNAPPSTLNSSTGAPLPLPTVPEPDVSLCPSLRNTLVSFAPSHDPPSVCGPQKVIVTAFAGIAPIANKSAVVIKILFM